MTRFFVDANGKYLGGFDGAEPPVGAIEVPDAPANAAQKWNGAGWDAVPDAVSAAQTLVETDAGMIRLAEDIFTALKGKGVLTDADLPQAARDKLAARAAARGKL